MTESSTYNLKFVSLRSTPPPVGWKMSCVEVVLPTHVPYPRNLLRLNWQRTGRDRDFESGFEKQVHILSCKHFPSLLCY